MCTRPPYGFIGRLRPRALDRFVSIQFCILLRFVFLLSSFLLKRVFRISTAPASAHVTLFLIFSTDCSPDTRVTRSPPSLSKSEGTRIRADFWPIQWPEKHRQPTVEVNPGNTATPSLHPPSLFCILAAVKELPASLLSGSYHSSLYFPSYLVFSCFTR